MIAVTLSCLFALATVAVLLSLVDSWLHAIGSARSLMQQRALYEAGFVPQVEQPAEGFRPAAMQRPFAYRRARSVAVKPRLRQLPPCDAA
ncbi:MAG: hypothetical protein WA985_09230 [Erythrobacter sp.]